MVTDVASVAMCKVTVTPGRYAQILDAAGNRPFRIQSAFDLSSPEHVKYEAYFWDGKEPVWFKSEDVRRATALAAGKRKPLTTEIPTVIPPPELRVMFTQNFRSCPGAPPGAEPAAQP
jgi:hypothetical protein